jgi:hypothetical protein
LILAAIGANIAIEASMIWRLGNIVRKTLTFAM